MSIHEADYIREVLEELLDNENLSEYAVHRIAKAVKHTYALEAKINDPR